jgi:YesN/AraC family two-component response regulator
MKKILLVEDEAIERNALKMIIEESDLPVRIIGTASNSVEALKLLAQNSIDLVFMDIKIPGKSGLELSKIIKEDYPSCSIVITTAHDEFELAHEAIKLHVDDYLLKPIRRNKIIESIKKYCLEKNNSDIEKCNKYMDSIINDIIQDNYISAIKKSEELIDCIFEISSGNLQIIWDLVKKSANKIYSYTDNFQITNKNRIKKNLFYLENKKEIYSNRYILKLNFTNFIKSIIKELLKNKNGFTGNINDVIAYIYININKYITLDETSEFFNISPFYLSKIFKKETGLNFTEYISITKINISKKLLINTDMQIVNIAIDLGYNEANYFSKVFKKIVGKSPTAYRQEHES